MTNRLGPQNPRRAIVKINIYDLERAELIADAMNELREKYKELHPDMPSGMANMSIALQACIMCGDFACQSAGLTDKQRLEAIKIIEELIVKIVGGIKPENN